MATWPYPGNKQWSFTWILQLFFLSIIFQALWRWERCLAYFRQRSSWGWMLSGMTRRSSDGYSCDCNNFVFFNQGKKDWVRAITCLYKQENTKASQTVSFQWNILSTSTICWIHAQTAFIAISTTSQAQFYHSITISIIVTLFGYVIYSSVDLHC